MVNIRLIITLFFIAKVISSTAQSPSFNSSAADPSDTYMSVPLLYDDKLLGKEFESKENFYEYPYTSNIINISYFKHNYPKANFPDILEIIPPNLDTTKTIKTLVGYLQPSMKTEGTLIVILAEYKKKEKVVFYIDNNLDNNFNNDDAPIIMNIGDAPRPITLYPHSVENSEITINISPSQRNDLYEIKNKLKYKLFHKFSIEINGGVGTGKLTYSYVNAGGELTQYNVNHSERGFGTLLAYNFPKVIVGTHLNFHNFYYFTSYLNTYKGQRVLTERNIDQHASSNIQWGLFSAYRLSLKKHTELQPMVKIGKTHYLSDQYFTDTRPNKETSYTLSNDTFLEYGFRVEFTTGLYRAFFISVLRNHTFWEPVNFLEDIEHENLDTRNTYIRLSLGFRFALSKKI